MIFPDEHLKMAFPRINRVYFSESQEFKFKILL